MALFIGGPADGRRIEVDETKSYLDIYLNPHPPGFTPDVNVLIPKTVPTFRYKRELIACGTQKFGIYVPNDWDCTTLVESLITGYKPELALKRVEYINSAEGTIYDNDDRSSDGRPYKV